MLTTYATRIRPYVDQELHASEAAERSGYLPVSFTHLERAHVLAQESTTQHVRVHWRMFVWGWRRRSVRECVGQLFRLTGAATKTVFGLVPSGNTGGSNVSPFKPMPVTDELAAIIQKAHGGS